jgi:predicted dehydrogenase
MTLRLGVVGIDHPHIFGMLANMMAQGCICTHWWSAGPSANDDLFAGVFPTVERVDDRRRILDDGSVDMVLISAVPSDRAGLAIEAMRAGKDVMVDKPGCTTLEQLAELRSVHAETGRIWSVNFSERFEVRAVTAADQLVRDGAIGRVIQTVNLAPHQQHLDRRPDWYFQRERYGGILTDIGSHQIDQFLHFTGSTDVTIEHALVENTTQPGYPEFQDFGEVTMRGDGGHGYVRVDWFTPDAMPTWGDGRLFLLGTQGTIEVRKYTEIGRDHRADNLYLVNGTENRFIDASEYGLPYFERLIDDVRDRTETAMTHDHAFRTMEVALWAQQLAEATDVASESRR